MKRKLFLIGGIVLFLAIVVGGTVIGIRRWRASNDAKIAKGLVARKNNDSQGGQQLDKHVVVYDGVLMLIRLRYVDEPDMRVATDGGLHGLLESLDANSGYLRDAKNAAPAGTAGIGAYISKRYTYGAVVAVLPGSPAERAGMQSGDIIESLNGSNTHALPLEELRRRLSGTAGTTLELSIVKVRQIEPQKVTVTLAEVAPPPLQQQMLPGNIGYISAQVLRKGRAQEMAEAIKSLEAQGARGLLLDLRDAAWGEAAEGAAVANLFLDHGRIAYLAGQKYTQISYDADPQRAVTKLPVSVLVNGGTAGAAEIAAAAILDNQRGDVVGEKTFGDASVQRLIESGDGRCAMILTVAKYYRSNGKPIQKNGVVPNVQASTDSQAALPTDQKNADAIAQARAAERQQQLQNAVESLQKKIGGGGQ
jgi:carboxyl-terminal processing protease